MFSSVGVLPMACAWALPEHPRVQCSIRMSCRQVRRCVCSSCFQAGWRSDTDSTPLDRDDRASRQLIRMDFQDSCARRSLFAGCQANQSDNSMMGEASYDGEFPKVLIECYENSLLLVREREDFHVAWVRIPVASPDRIMPCCGYSGQGSALNPGIEQDLHELVPMICGGSTRSCATSRRA